MRPPRWTEEATDPDPGEVAALLDGDPALAGLVADATEPLEDEVRALVRRAAPVPRRRLPLALPLLALLAVALFFTFPREETAATFRAEGGGAWSVVEASAGTTVVAQTAGVVVWDVDPRPPGERFVVRAGALEVEVVGTVFEVGMAGDDAWVVVREGAVRVRDAGVEATVVSGSRWDRPRAPIAVAPEVPPEVPAEVARAPEPVRQRTRPPPPPERASPELPAISAPAQFAVLLDRRDAGERTPELAAAFRAFAAAAPGSPLGAQAETEALVLDAAILDPTEAIAAIDRWLERHPGTPRRLALLEVRAHTARERLQDCAVALPTYRTLVRLTSGERQGRAQAWRGLCATDPAERTEALREALRLGVAPPLRDEVELALEEQL